MYENEKLKNLLGYGRGRFSSLWKIYTDDRVPEDFFELKLKYLGIIVDKGKNYLDMNKNEIRIKEFEEYNNAFATLSKLLGKMDKQRKSLMKNKYSRILLITLISFMFPELLLSQPLFCSIFRTNTLYQYKVLGLGA